MKPRETFLAGKGHPGLTPKKLSDGVQDLLATRLIFQIKLQRKRALAPKHTDGDSLGTRLVATRNHIEQLLPTQNCLALTQKLYD